MPGKNFINNFKQTHNFKLISSGYRKKGKTHSRNFNLAENQNFLAISAEREGGIRHFRHRSGIHAHMTL